MFYVLNKPINIYEHFAGFQNLRVMITLYTVSHDEQKNWD